MIFSFRRRRKSSLRNRSSSPMTSISNQKSLKDALKPQQSPTSTPHLVIVMDALRDYSILPLLWALENLVTSGCIVTLLGIMPWLNIPLSSKTPEVWGLEFEELAMVQATYGSNMDPKYLKLQAIVDLCKRFGAVLKKEVIMGFPLKSVVVEKIARLEATWVVCDRHQKRNREFFAKRIGCNIVMMNEKGEADMIKGRPMMDDGDSIPEESPASFIPTPQLIIPDYWKDTLN